MENIIKYAGEGLDDRRIDFLLTTPQQDGGDWDPMVALVEKYGVVPREAMPDTKVTLDTAEFNAVLNRLLRRDALELRDMVRSGKSAEELDKTRKSMLSDIYRMLCVSFGQPPEKVDFEYRDKDNRYHAEAHGKPVGHQGYFIMDDSWFDAYMFEIAVRPQYLPEEYRKTFESEPEVLPYWNTFNPEP